MVYLWAVMAVVGPVSLLNLILAFAIVRRLRIIEENQGSHSSNSLPGVLPVGSKAPSFAAATTTGETIESTGLSGKMVLIGFFSGTCAPCRDHLPEFTKLADSVAGPGYASIAVVRGDDDAVADLMELVGTSVTVIREPEGGPVGEAFTIKTYPSMYLINDAGTIVSAAHIAHQLSVPILR